MELINQEQTGPKFIEITGVTSPMWRPTYSTWRSMHRRCYHEDYDGFSDYGGRGIIVAEPWHTLEGFVADMGIRPEDRTLDRIDPDGIYEAANCRWATSQEQAWNKTNTQYYEYEGELLTRLDIMKMTGLSYEAVRSRTRRSWSVEKIINIPLLEVNTTYEYQGKEYTVRELSGIFGISIRSTYRRLASPKWPNYEPAVTTPSKRR